MTNFKNLFVKSLSMGLHPGLGEGEKFVLRVATFDGYWSVLLFVFYTIYSYVNNLYPMVYLHMVYLLLVLIGLYSIYKHHYDLGRVIIHLTGLSAIFLTADAVGTNSGYEFYYFVQIIMPHISFSLNEIWKGAILSTVACLALITQQIIGTGIFFEITPVPASDKIIALVSVMFFTLSVLIVARWKLLLVRTEIDEQHSELTHSANLIALGEMSGGIAHEINNPLQSISLQVTVLREKLKDSNNFSEDIHQHLGKIDGMVFKMSRMVQGLKDLSRRDDSKGDEDYYFSKVLDDVLVISTERLKEHGIKLSIIGDTTFKLSGNSLQISQVLINLLNNAIDAVQHFEEKWIKIDIAEKNRFVQVCVTDSGHGISADVVEKMMKPFFTTKEPNKGTGLGLSISKSILEKNKGSLYYDSTGPNTRFVMLLPISDVPIG